MLMLMVPLLLPQLGCITNGETVIALAEPTVVDAVLIQPLLSVICTKYTPAQRLLSVEVFAGGAIQLYVIGAVPPIGLTATEPLQLLAHVSF
jgi:hypothetical protein